MKQDELLGHNFLLSTPRFQRSLWEPSVDVYQGQEGWLVKFDLAGVRLEDLELTVRGCQLCVRGVRRDWKILQGQRAWSIEIAYNEFARTIEMPCGGAIEITSSEYRDGMLLVVICETEAPR